MMKIDAAELVGVTCGPSVSRPVDHDGQRQDGKREGEQPRRGAGTEREAAHAGQIVRGDEREQRQQDQRHAAVEVLRVLNAQQIQRPPRCRPR